MNGIKGEYGFPNPSVGGISAITSEEKAKWRKKSVPTFIVQSILIKYG